MKRFLTLVLPWLLVLAVGACACLLRYELVESADVARVCDTSHTFACDLRHWTVLGFITGNIFNWPIGIFGWVAMASAVLALRWPRLVLATLATATGLFAVVLYCFVPGALALLVGSLRLVRLQAAGAAPADQHGATERKVHA
jgi:hypothetical protein